MALFLEKSFRVGRRRVTSAVVFPYSKTRASITSHIPEIRIRNIFEITFRFGPPKIIINFEKCTGKML